MGCSPGDYACAADEEPAHDVEITRGFWMGQTEVTQSAWKKVMGTDPSYFKGNQLPVETVSWDEADKYCKAAGLRLPSEAEWEYAARAGTKGPRYADFPGITWYDANSGMQTHTVAQKAANAFGLYDMLGNVREWVNDWYWSSQYARREGRDPKGPAEGGRRVLRGGAWDDSSQRSRASVRIAYPPGSWYKTNGFRCAGELP
jgi:formylglycine-generating enzyme required for sulfatase activity